MTTYNSVSAGGVILNLKGEICIVNQQHRSWSLPKGHIAPEESLEGTARREIYEETGLTQLALLGYLGQFSRYKMTESGHDDMAEYKTIHLYIYQTMETQLHPIDPDNPVAQWVSVTTAISRLTHPKDKAFLSDYQTTIMQYYYNQWVTLTTTVASHEDGLALSRQLIDQKLASCAQMDTPVTSTYRWDHDIKYTPEFRITIKKHRLCVPKIEQLFQAVHPYDTPQFTCIPMAYISQDYITFMANTLAVSSAS
jgi:periplasmic divalent cation tolerance protein